MNSKFSYNDSEPLWHCGWAALNGSPCIRRPMGTQRCSTLREYNRGCGAQIRTVLCPPSGWGHHAPTLAGAGRDRQDPAARVGQGMRTDVANGDRWLSWASAPPGQPGSARTPVGLRCESWGPVGVAAISAQEASFSGANRRWPTCDRGRLPRPRELGVGARPS